jgi:hypothetical protein
MKTTYEEIKDWQRAIHKRQERADKLFVYAFHGIAILFISAILVIGIVSIIQTAMKGC